jgi:hypothetical protein
MLKGLDELIERRIAEAQQRGDFDGLPGAGRPLPEEDMTGVPQELRVAIRVLRNAGAVPAEIEALRDLDGLLSQLAAHDARGASPDDPARRLGERRLLALTLALEARGLGTTARAMREYRERLVARLGGEAACPGGQDGRERSGQ